MVYFDSTLPYLENEVLFNIGHLRLFLKSKVLFDIVVLPQVGVVGEFKK